jgi:hypothetical protein
MRNEGRRPIWVNQIPNKKKNTFILFLLIFFLSLFTLLGLIFIYICWKLKVFYILVGKVISFLLLFLNEDSNILLFLNKLKCYLDFSQLSMKRYSFIINFPRAFFFSEKGYFYSFTFSLFFLNNQFIIIAGTWFSYSWQFFITPSCIEIFLNVMLTNETNLKPAVFKIIPISSVTFSLINKICASCCPSFLLKLEPGSYSFFLDSLRIQFQYLL